MSHTSHEGQARWFWEKCKILEVAIRNEAFAEYRSQTGRLLAAPRGAKQYAEIGIARFSGKGVEGMGRKMILAALLSALISEPKPKQETQSTEEGT